MDAAATVSRTEHGRSTVLPPAAYLRSDLGAEAVLQGHRDALRRFAGRLGVPVPVFYEDLVPPDAAEERSLPRFEALTRAVLDGSHRLLLIPGPWALARGEAGVAAAVRLLTAAGCRRILSPPPPVRAVRLGRGARNVGPSWARETLRQAGEVRR